MIPGEIMFPMRSQIIHDTALCEEVLIAEDTQFIKMFRVVCHGFLSVKILH